MSPPDKRTTPATMAAKPTASHRGPETPPATRSPNRTTPITTATRVEATVSVGIEKRKWPAWKALWAKKIPTSAETATA